MRPCRELLLTLTPLAALMASLGMPSAGRAQIPLAADAPRFVNISERLLLLDVSVNGRNTGRWTLLERNGVLHAPADAFVAWQVRRRASAESVEFRGVSYFALAAVPGFEARIVGAGAAPTLQLNDTAYVAAAPVATPIPNQTPQTSVIQQALTPPIAAPPVAAPLAPSMASPAPVPATQPPASNRAKTQSTPTIIASSATQVAAASPAFSSSPSDAGKDRLLPLEVVVNNAAGGQWTLLERNGVLHAPEDAFEEWRLTRDPKVKPADYRGQYYYPLNSVPGYQARLNFANQSVDLSFAPAAFSATRLSGQAVTRPELTPAIPAVFLNYDLTYNQSNFNGGTGTRDLSALAEMGFSGSWGVLTSSFVGRNLTSDSSGGSRSGRRLETTFNKDMLDSGLTLRIGDTSTRSGLTSRAVYFGGIQLSRNFGLTPGFVSQPVPSITGSSSAPSTVELYINDALRQTSNVPTGPFAIDNFPLLTGGGQARIVVRDILGRETVQVIPFFSHSNLLEQGLGDWSVEAGAVRRNLGIDNASYGQRFSSGILRYGFSKEFTAETTAQWGQDIRGVGLGVTYALPWQILGQAAASVSDDRLLGRGSQWLLGAEHTGLQHGFSLRTEGATDGYRQMGSEAIALPFKTQVSGNYSYATEDFGALGLGMARIDAYGRGPITTYSANYSTRLGERSSLTLTATRVLGASTGSALGVSFQIPLESRINVAGNVARRSGQTDAYVSAAQNIRSDSGIGWRALAGTRTGSAFSEGGLYYQGDRGLLTADISASSQAQNVRLGAQGGVVALDGRAFATRKVQDAFALVEVPGYANVGVQFQGSRLARTDASGVALLPRLSAFNANRIQLDPNELPISAELDTIEQTAVPAARTGVKVLFPVRSGRGALLKIVLDDGEPAPAGAELELIGDKKDFFVARRGEAFVTGLQTTNQIRLKWNAASCTFTLSLPPGSLDEIARVGPLLCSGVTR